MWMISDYTLDCMSEEGQRDKKQERGARLSRACIWVKGF